MSPSLSIIIPTRDREPILYKTVNALIQLSDNFQFEIIIVNDSENAITPTGVLKRDFIKIIKNTKQGNAACARNSGASAASYNLLLFIDDDIIINHDCLQFAIESHQLDKKKLLNFNWTYPDEVIRACKTSPFGRFLIKEELFHMKGWRQKLLWKENSFFEVEAVASFFMLIDKIDYFSIRGFNENFPFAGGEDIDFSKRIAEKGFCFYLNTKLQVYHNEEDRIIPYNWLQRKYRSGITFAVANSNGYAEYNKTYSTKDRINYFLIGIAKPFIFWYTKLNRGPKILDRLYFKSIHIFLYYYLQKGWKEGIKTHVQ